MSPHGRSNRRARTLRAQQYDVALDAGPERPIGPQDGNRPKGPVELCGDSPYREESLDVLALMFRGLLQRLH